METRKFVRMVRHKYFGKFLTVIASCSARPLPCMTLKVVEPSWRLPVANWIEFRNPNLRKEGPVANGQDASNVFLKSSERDTVHTLQDSWRNTLCREL